jgi:hypothetical protein
VHHQQPLIMSTYKDIAGIKFKSLRHCIGLLGLALPWLIRLVALIFDDCDCLQDSISHYYFTIAGPCFVGIMCGLGLSLAFYPTPNSPPDRIAYSPFGGFRRELDGPFTTVSGVCAFLVALVPTDAFSNDECAIFHFDANTLRTSIHYAAAATMLVLFSYMSICHFTRTHDKDWRQKKWKARRNYTYLICGIFTFLSVATIGTLALLEHFAGTWVHPKTTYWLEVVALTPFGISWLVKGGFIMTDEKEPSTVKQLKTLVTKGRLVKDSEMNNK